MGYVSLYREGRGRSGVVERGARALETTKTRDTLVYAGTRRNAMEPQIWCSTFYVIGSSSTRVSYV